MPKDESDDGLTLDQRRAKHALNAVQQVVCKNKEYASDFLSYVRSMPMMLRQNGLGQTIALEMAQSNGAKKEGHELLLKHVLTWICNNNKNSGWANTPYQIKADDNAVQWAKDLLVALVGQSEQDAIRTQYELMAYLKWLKAFSEALIAIKPENGGNDKDEGTERNLEPSGAAP